MSKKTVFWLSKNEKLAKKVDFRKFLDPIWDLALKRVSKFVIPEFRDTLLVPKITKCGDLRTFLLRSPEIFKKSEKGWKSKRKCESSHDLDYIPSLATLEFKKKLDYE